jgi:CDGSH-type Zn-finger protein
LVADAPIETRLALCRCGASHNKPYCDGSHTKAGFKDAGALPPADDGADEPAVATDGALLSVSPTTNGPLHCTGALAVIGTDGRSTVTSQTWLCRCGGSKSKPFCDGTHKRIGFAG